MMGKKETSLGFAGVPDEEGSEGVGGRLQAKGLLATAETVAMNRWEEAVRQLRKMDGLDLDKPEVMATAWR